MESTYQSLAERVIRKWEEKKSAQGLTSDKSTRLLIALAGPPGSGKTTIATRVVDAVNQHLSPHPKTVAIPADGFHLSRAVLRALPNAEEAFARRGAPWTFDGAGVVALVHDLRVNGVETRAPAFDHATKDPIVDALVVGPDIEVCILEGNYLLCDEPPWDAIAAAVDDRWLVEVEPELARARVAARHLKAGIETKMEDALRRAEQNDMVNGKFVMERSLGREDLLVHSVEESRSV